ncbi:MAG: excinuclease ABC subunit UvrA [Clostridiales bacterium]|jgi:excinuclease ABC subunit A|nr:excinuclease ABC subunit UvrA [Clostridiales bacterium]
MPSDKIIIKGARENNLKNISLEIPRDKMVVFTGESGSGKSSLAFETIYAEGQRRYMESLSSYARPFLGQMSKPDVDNIEGLSPAISIDQKTTSHNPRSTVGTVTEIYDYFRLLFARIGIPHCPQCGKEIKRQTVDQIVDGIMSLAEGSRVQLLAPVVRARKGEHAKVLEDARQSGYVRARVNGTAVELADDIKLEKNKKHTIEIIIDRLTIRPGIEKRLAGSIETVMQLSGGLLTVMTDEGDIMYSQNYSCPDCGVSLEEVEPRMFSFNNPAGACPDCTGLGFQMKFDPELIIPDDSLSLVNGAVNAIGYTAASNDSSMNGNIFRSLAKHYDFDVNTPYRDLPERIKNVILYGSDGEKITIEYQSGGTTRYYQWAFEGVISSLNRRYRETSSPGMKEAYEQFITRVSCPTCGGKRLKPEILAVTVKEKSIADLTDMSVTNVKAFFDAIELTRTEAYIAEQLLKEIKARLGFLVNVGLDYLTLSRVAGTLSGGESQRIRLATQIGSGLVGVVYILDEPSIGLHQRDNDKLLRTLKGLRDLGNTLIVVEHDNDTMLQSDYVVDIGPGAGRLGGEVIFAGAVKDMLECEESVTGAYLSGRLQVETPAKRRPLNGHYLTIVGAGENNLKNIDVKIPLGVITCVTGVSGSGKSSLVNEIIYKRLARDLNRAKMKAGKHTDLRGQEFLDKVIDIDQSPIGRTPRSNPATYTGLFDLIRDLFAQTSEARIRGYSKGRFSFNVKGGRCEACGGDGIKRISMHFLPDVFVPCEVCHGKRYNRETLEVKYKGKSITDVLDMTVEEALGFFENQPRLKQLVQTLYDVGLSYITLGQSSTTLSGGEAQRVKLATELARRSTGRTVYILDEPTTGLHSADVHKLTKILQKLAEGGNTVIVIEHNMDVIKTADYIIDMGPEGGDKGGRIVVAGAPEEVARHKKSYTAKYLKDILKK